MIDPTKRQRAIASGPPDDTPSSSPMPLPAHANLVLGTPPESLDKTELAVLLALTPQLTELSNLPGFDPTDVTGSGSWLRDAHGRGDR